MRWLSNLLNTTRGIDGRGMCVRASITFATAFMMPVMTMATAFSVGAANWRAAKIGIQRAANRAAPTASSDPVILKMPPPVQAAWYYLHASALLFAIMVS